MLAATCFLSSFNSAAVGRRGVQVSLQVRPATTVASAWHAGWRPTAERRIGSAQTRRPCHCWAPLRRWQAPWLGMGIFSEKNSGNVHYLKKIKQCLVGECWVWGLIILFIILLYSSFFIGDYHIPIGKSYEKRWIQGGKLWTVGASRWLKQSFVSQLGVKRFDGTSFVTYSYFELRYILFGWIHQASWCLYAMFDCHRVFTFAFTFTEPWSWWTWWMIKVGRGRAEKGFNTYWLVVSTWLLFSMIYGMSSFPLTNIFQDGYCTTKQKCYH